MISLISDPFKVESNYTRPIEHIIENYFDCNSEYLLDDGYVRDYEGDTPTYFKGYQEYVINSCSNTYFDFNQQVNLISLTTGDDDLPEINKNKISEVGNRSTVLYVPLPYIFSLLTKQDISFYEIDIATYQGKKTTILSTGDIVTVNLQLSENAPKIN